MQAAVEADGDFEDENVVLAERAALGFRHELFRKVGAAGDGADLHPLEAVVDLDIHRHLRIARQAVGRHDADGQGDDRGDHLAHRFEAGGVVIHAGVGGEGRLKFHLPELLEAHVRGGLLLLAAVGAARLPDAERQPGAGVRVEKVRHVGVGGRGGLGPEDQFRLGRRQLLLHPDVGVAVGVGDEMAGDERRRFHPPHVPGRVDGPEEGANLVGKVPDERLATKDFALLPMDEGIHVENAEHGLISRDGH